MVVIARAVGTIVAAGTMDTAQAGATGRARGGSIMYKSRDWRRCNNEAGTRRWAGIWELTAGDRLWTHYLLKCARS